MCIRDRVKNYTGYERDSVLGMYYAKARLYDTADKHGSTKGNKLGDKRFMAVDPVKGTTRNPQSMVQYTYTLNNPLMYVDPLGLFKSGDVLQKEGWFSKKTNNYNDMVDLQIRLMTTGYLTADDLNFTAGKFNGTVEKAVKKFQGQNGLDTNGKVDEATWRALGLWVMEEGTLTISAPNTTVDPDIEWGVNAAQDDLAEILSRERHAKELLLADGSRLIQWNLQYFTYVNSYYDKLQCMKGEPVVAGAVAKGYDLTAALASGYQEGVGSFGPWLPGVAAGTAWSAFWIYHEPGAQDAVDAYYVEYDNKIAQAEAEANSINNSIMRYVIAPDMAGNNYSTLVNIYNNDIAKEAHDTIRRYGEGSVQNLSVGNLAYVSYLENVMRINFDKNSHQFILKTILP